RRLVAGPHVAGAYVVPERRALGRHGRPRQGRAASQQFNTHSPLLGGHALLLRAHFPSPSESLRRSINATSRRNSDKVAEKGIGPVVRRRRTARKNPTPKPAYRTTSTPKAQ